MTLATKDARVNWVISSTTNEEVTSRYDLWAEAYDADLQSYGYRSPGMVAGMVGRYVPEDGSPLLDAGTGIMGEVLAVLGYQDITALDISQGMLDVAERKGVYSGLKQAALGEPLDFPNDHFGSLVCVGTLVDGHAPPRSFDELLRITRPGGHIVFTVRTDVYHDGGFKEKQNDLESSGAWRLVESTQPYVSVPGSDQLEGTNMILVYQVG
jgi:predicted TPR repeat methyltransferase